MSKQKIKMPCEICKKDSTKGDGWHLSDDLNFCSSKCVAIFLERFAVRQKDLEQRISAMEKITFKNRKVEAVKCGKCKQFFFVSQKEFERLKRQKLSIYCPHQRHTAVKFK